MWKFLSALSLLLVSFAASTASSFSLSSNIASVASGGYWVAGGNSGSYRVVVVNSGYEHVTSRLFVQWVAGPKSQSGEPLVVASVEPELPFSGVASLQATLEPVVKGKIVILVSGVVAYQPTRKVEATITATEPGHVTVKSG